MMYCMSVSHKKAPVNLREQFAFLEAEKEELMRRLLKKDSIAGVVILSTCNRSEIYISGNKYAIGELQQEVADVKNLRMGELLKYVNIYSEENAIRHLFKVTCGLDSMVLGEDEILGQVKDAYQKSKEFLATDYEINEMFKKAVTCAKRIKTDTNLSKTPLSIATLVANEVFHLEKTDGQKNVMIIGMSGKIGSTITKNLLSKSGVFITATVRNHGMDFNFEVKDNRIKEVDYRNRYDYIEKMDVVISATSGPHYTVIGEELSCHLTSKKERLFIDVAVPVDMDPGLHKINGITLHDIDYFNECSKNNTQIKRKELDRAKAIMEEELDEAMRDIMFHPYIKKMKSLKESLEGKPLETLLYQIRDHVTREELDVVLKTLDGLTQWTKEG
ncbi:glutamyl-tRNA reductase [Clostridium sp. E02]|uniref:glutamyl-tRNA reductase n=1 Tax=Clostridium sp. E02 TaxID=2487134 RepID=UPI001FA9F05B|nr:glutamyl-tRNA reductase [Clostridium sp. E02]